MFRPRVIPCLLLRGTGLVKTSKFSSPVYLGEAINAIRIFNDKGVDELILLDIHATRENRRPNLALISEIASECFMPLCYGGGVRSAEDVQAILDCGVEKVAINAAALDNPAMIEQAARRSGSQSVVVSIDVKRDLFGRRRVVSHGASRKTALGPVEHAKRVAELGAGEILINSVERDGTMTGYDHALAGEVAHAVDVPVIACGGASGLNDMRAAVAAGASAVAAGALFVFHGPHRAVLINYPGEAELDAAFAAGK